MLSVKYTEGDVFGGAKFSDCGKYRYVLWRTWDIDKPPVNWIMLNPSTADESEDDPTIRRCIGFTQRWGYGGIVITNLFAFRATNPNNLFKTNNPIGVLNDISIEGNCWSNRHNCFLKIIAAWGARGVFEVRDQAAMNLIDTHDVYCLGKTKSGQPKHPLYLKYSTPLEIYYTGEDK